MYEIDNSDLELTPEIKAFLVSIGSVQVDLSIELPGHTTTATAGPGAGGTSIFFKSNNRRVRLSINNKSPLYLTENENVATISYRGKPIVRGELEKPLYHCPKQAYITISESCIYNCKFCPVPEIPGDVKDTDTILKMVDEAYSTGELEAVSLTSGVAESPYREVEKTTEIVKQISKRYDIPIGVSVYPTWTSTHDLFEVGATEIKYNVETMDMSVFKKVCPDFDLRHILDSLDEAVNIFGKNRVSSNFLIGLGEDDACVKEGVTFLAKKGVIPVLRPVSPASLQRNEISAKRPGFERLLKLSQMSKDILDKYGLRADRAKTMCVPCTGCDITPHHDIR
ncbi:radical SAM protein [Methanohalobium sp.]|uniref:radical SAM protein n=1 Tax=Methanohalobium sp. TaxID=2837493 RepID=UPI0025E10FE3|nr:radical SAM protein [Methanohalobium sp.]